jgi:YHS domain-containing protein
MSMNKMFTGVILVLIFSLFNVSSAQNKETVKETTKTEMNQTDNTVEPWNEVCPVKGGKVQKGTTIVEYNEKQYGFCCPGCDTKFVKDPEKYSKHLSKDGKKFIGKKK